MIYEILMAGLDALAGYLSEHVLTCLIPAFFIAGAISAFISKESILRYFGSKTKKYISYPIASVSGAILAVCSCTILPIFSGIYRRGGGIGPAVAFLYSGPAINVLAIVFTARVLGFDIGIARAIFSIPHDFSDEREISSSHEYKGRKRWDKIFVFVALILILIMATFPASWYIKFPVIYLLTILISYALIFYYEKEEVKNWGYETWWLVKKIFPVLIVGVFLVGIIGGIASQYTGEKPDIAVGTLVKNYVGSNSIYSCFIASIIGALLYMPTLLEVPILNDLFGYSSGMIGSGPALSLLLSGPSVSLPSMVVLSRIIGVKKTFVYISLVVALSTLIGYIFGVIS
ncbi:MAG: permease [Thermoplasmatales archaeon]|nr:permease [Thermoplasmatales archaeon]